MFLVLASELGNNPGAEFSPLFKEVLLADYKEQNQTQYSEQSHSPKSKSPIADIYKELPNPRPTKNNTANSFVPTNNNLQNIHQNIHQNNYQIPLNSHQNHYPIPAIPNFSIDQKSMKNPLAIHNIDSIMDSRLSSNAALDAYCNVFNGYVNEFTGIDFASMVPKYDT